MSSKKPPGDYEVGYGKPPQHKQFKKGRSGNPKGRPRRPADESLRTSFKRLILKRQQVTINGSRINMDHFEMTMTQLFHKSSTGNLAASKELRQWIKIFDLQHDNQIEDPFACLSLNRREPMDDEYDDDDSAEDGEDADDDSCEE